jgi:hypothetical protein
MNVHVQALEILFSKGNVDIRIHLNELNQGLGIYQQKYLLDVYGDMPFGPIRSLQILSTPEL